MYRSPFSALDHHSWDFSIVDIGQRFIALKAGDLSVQSTRYFSSVVVVGLRENKVRTLSLLKQKQTFKWITKMTAQQEIGPYCMCLKQHYHPKVLRLHTPSSCTLYVLYFFEWNNVTCTMKSHVVKRCFYFNAINFNFNLFLSKTLKTFCVFSETLDMLFMWSK